MTQLPEVGGVSFVMKANDTAPDVGSAGRPLSVELTWHLTYVVDRTEIRGTAL